MHIRSLLLVCSLASLSLPASAQGIEWVTNGDFTGTLTPWVMGGAYSANPGLDTTWDTTGLGVSDSFGCHAGGQVTPPPYPPNTLEQQILVISGLTYEFRCDASGARPTNPTVANADIGTIWVEVNGVEVARFAFGSYTPQEVKRAQVVGRFTANTSGLVPLTIYFQRAYLGGVANPRMNIDNVSVKDVIGPTYSIRQNRKLGTTLNFDVRGDANAFYATFISAGQGPGIPIAGVLGLFQLDLLQSELLQLGMLDGQGFATNTLFIPNRPFLLTNPFFFQAGSDNGVVLALGHHFGCVFTQ